MSFIKYLQTLYSQDESAKSLIIKLTLVSFLSSFILSFVIILMDNLIKYPLFAFGVTVSLLLFLRLRGNQTTFITMAWEHRVQLMDYILTALTAFMFISILFNLLPSSSVLFVVSTIVIAMVPGWVTYRLLIARMYKNRDEDSLLLEMIIISFFVSIGISSIIITVLITTNQATAITLGSVYLVISMLPLIQIVFVDRKKSAYRNNIRRRYNLYEVLLILWSLIFFCFVVLNLYPMMSFIPGIDVIRHLADAKQLLSSPGFYNSEYPWFHLFEAAGILISNPPDWLFHSGFAFLGICVIFSFYLAARSYLKSIDTRSVILSTIFFVAVSGFGWLYLVEQEFFLDIEDQTYVQNLVKAHFVSYWDIGFGQSPWLWFWFRPVTLGFSIFFVLLHLLTRIEIQRTGFIAVCTFLLLLLFQIHLPEFVLFGVLILVLSIFTPSVVRQLRQMALSYLFAIPVALCFDLFHDRILASTYSPASFAIYTLLIGLATATYLFTRFSKRPKLRSKIQLAQSSDSASGSVSRSTRLRGKLPLLGIICLIGAYSVIVYSWLLDADVSNIPQIASILSIPPQYYPMLLGIVGLLTIPGSFVILRDFRSNSVIVFFLLLLIIIVVGRILSYLQIIEIVPGYWERRVLPLVFASCAIISAVYVPRVFDGLKRWIKSTGQHTAILRDLSTTAIISALVLAGSLSTFLSIEHTLYTQEQAKMNDEELRLLAQFEGSYSNSTLLTVTQRSVHVAENSPIGWIIRDFRHQIWPSSSPEIPLYFLSIAGTPSIIMLTERDIEEIAENKPYQQGFVNFFLIDYLNSLSSSVFNQISTTNGIADGRVMRVPSVSSPTAVSDTVLYLPKEQSATKLENSYKLYLLLSLARVNYTTVLNEDITSLRKAKNVIAVDEESAYELFMLRSRYDLPFQKIIIFNTDGYGQIFNLSSSQNIDLFNMTRDGEWNTNSSGSTQDENDHSSNVVRHNNFIEIIPNNISGSLDRWEISRSLSQTFDVRGSNAIIFNWYGRDDGRSYAIQLWSGDNNKNTSNNNNTNIGYDSNYRSSWIKFTDDWIGWRQIVLPLRDRLEISSGDSFGVKYQLISNQGVLRNLKGLSLTADTSQGPILNGSNYLGPIAFGSIEPVEADTVISDIDSGYPSRVLLNNSIDVYILDQKSGFSTIQYYSTENETRKVPFIMSNILDKNDNNLTINYINIWPLVSGFDKLDLSKLTLIDNSISHITSDLRSFDFQPRFDAIDNFLSNRILAYDSATIRGNTTIVAPSMIINVNGSGKPESTQATAVRVDSKERTYNDAPIQIIPIDTGAIALKTDSASIKGYQGFYSELRSNRSIVSITGSEPKVGLVFDNSTISVVSGDRIDISLGPSTIIAREPNIAVNGSTSFTSLYGYGVVGKQILTKGLDLDIIGEIIFNNKFSDNSIIAEQSYINGSVARPVPLYAHDELGFLFRIVSWENMPRYLILISIIIIAYGVYRAAVRRGRKSQISVDS
jgi:hypothetical protein